MGCIKETNTRSRTYCVFDPNPIINRTEILIFITWALLYQKV